MSELAQHTEDLAAEHGHWAAFDNDGRGSFVCNCGLYWISGEGCAFVQGIRAGQLGRADAWDEGRWWWFTGDESAARGANPYRAEAS